MRTARIADAAKLELIAEVEYFESKEAGLGSRFLASVQEAVLRALIYPLTGSQYRGNTRRLLVRDFPFAVVYRCHKDEIVIFAFAHLSRRPGYWRSRIDNA
ncbi:type II toxin-antitoxin system RelE/ParE family toxin [Cyanobium sp. Alchichica 3B3-8F6]|nr:type II toxin-antitoxin system RelE/ParE family toxin [Cyanobium sp. Alchichica 3B3-8F6]